MTVRENVEKFLRKTANQGWFLKSLHPLADDRTSISFYSREMNQIEFRPYLKIRIR